MGRRLENAIAKLQGEFSQLDWTYHDLPCRRRVEQMYCWPGPAAEEVMVCVHKSGGVQERFHRHDFFYFNYTYRGEYDSLSCRDDHRITIRERELYAGQPFAGHALCVHDDQEVVIIGLLIRRETFFRTFLPLLRTDTPLFHFLIDPASDPYVHEFLHLSLQGDCTVRTLLEMMVLEYADKKEDTQGVLKSLALAFLMQVARRATSFHRRTPPPQSMAEEMVRYIGEHPDTATLKGLAERFSYHPNYISTLLRRETGKSFTEIQLEQRLTRAAALLRGTDLPVADVARMVGYSSSSNFYRAFRARYGQSPRALLGDGSPPSP